MLSVKQKESHLENKIDNIVNDYFVDDDGFLISPEQWTEAFAARTLGLLPRSLSSQHKDVLHYVIINICILVHCHRSGMFVNR